MRLITWNVERPGFKSPKNAVRVRQILGLKPDIALLTETSCAVDLGAVFVGFFTAPSPRKPRRGEAVAAIWFRRSMFSFVRKIETADPREAVCLELECRSGPLLVYGSIIPYHGYKGPTGTSGRWEEHKQAITWHREDWVKLRAARPDLVSGIISYVY